MQANANQIRKLAEKVDADTAFDGLGWAREHGIEVDTAHVEERIRSDISRHLLSLGVIS